MRKIIVTCGPASTAIDRVRRITNFSTGELGTLLAEALIHSDYKVTVFRGEGATFRPPAGMEVASFVSNDDLLELFQKFAANGTVAAIYHAAALTDFRVAGVTDETGRDLHAGKISSSNREIFLRLTPESKVISELRRLFPTSFITGWKYELDGDYESALAKGRTQIRECQTDATVVNGDAIGEGFVYLGSEDVVPLPNKKALVQFLVEELNRLYLSALNRDNRE